jgi:ABC-2 type transport system permease protein
MVRVSWLIEIGYWTLLDIIIFGSLGSAATMLTGGTNQIMIQTLVTNAVLWYLVIRGALSIGFTLLNELYDANFIALFATPLRTLEWIIASAIVGTLGALTNLMLGWGTALLVFNCNVLALGAPVIIIIIGLLLIAGWIVGLLLMCVLLFVGKKGTGLAFAICWSLAPFSCVYYSTEALPLFLQKIVTWIPMSHVFTATRAFIATRAWQWRELLIGLGLNSLYLILACVLFALMFGRSKKRGLARLELEW